MEAEGGQTAPAARMTLTGGAGAGKRNPSLRAGIAVRPPPAAGSLCGMDARRLRPWLPFAALPVAVVMLAVVRDFRPAPPAPPVLMAPPPYDNAALLREQLQSLHVEGAVVPCPGRSDAWYVVAPGADASAVVGLPATPEYADCWQGVLLAVAVGKTDDGPYEVQARSFHFFGDAGKVRQIREAMDHPAAP